MATIDLSTAIGRVRLSIGDTADIPVLADATIQYFLDKNSNNESAATREAAYAVLATLSFGTSARLGQIQLYGSERFNNYLKYIQTVINDPVNSVNRVATYAAGAFYSDKTAYDADTDVIHSKKHVSVLDCHRMGLWSWDDYDD